MGTFGSSADFQRPTPRVTGSPSIPAAPDLSTAGAETLYAQGQQTKELAAAVDHFGQVMDETAAQDALNQLRTKRQELTLDPQKGVASLKGGDVLKQGPSGKPWLQEFPDQFRQSADDLAGKLISPRAKAMFRDAAAKEQIGFKGDVLRHITGETEKWEAAVYKDTNALILNSAATTTDPAALDGLAQRAENAARNRARQLGVPAEALIAGAKSDVYQISIKSLIAKGDGYNATMLYQRYESMFDAKDRVELQTLLKTAQRQDVARSYVDGLTPPPDATDAEGVIRHHEGLLLRPKVDTDGRLRVGYGSDTVTTADGKVIPVNADTVVTEEDAKRDLKRRAAEYQDAVRKQVGDEAWSKLSPEAKASLTSLTYNYGTNWSALKPVIDAAKGGDKKQIADAIRGLSVHNGGINARRRNQEADAVLNAKEADPLAVSINAQTPEGKKADGPPGFFNAHHMMADVEAQHLDALAKNDRDWAHDPAQLSENKSRINVVFEQKKRAISLEETRLKGEVDNWLTTGGPNGGPPLTRPPAQLWNKLSYQQRDMIDKNILHNAKGTDAITDQATWYEIQRGLSSADPSERARWAAEPLWKYKDKLSNSDFQELAKMQGTVRKGDPDKELSHVRNLNQMADDTMNKIGIDPTPKPNSTDAAKAARFRRALQDEVSLFEVDKGRKSTPEEQQKIIDGLVRQITVGSRSWFGFTTTEPTFNITIQNVPKDKRAQIEDSLRFNKKPITDEAIVDIYRRWRVRNPDASPEKK